MDKELSPEQYKIIQLIGSTEEKALIYSDYRCPESVLRVAAESIKGFHDQWIFDSLEKNPATSTDIINVIQDLVDASIFPLPDKRTLQKFVNHPVNKRWVLAELFSLSNLEVRLSQICCGNDDLYKIVHDNIFISGGSISSIINFSHVNDIDIWFKSERSAVEFCTHVFQMLGMKNSRIEVVGNQISIKDGVTKNTTIVWMDQKIYITDNAITFSDVANRVRPIQFIIREFGEPSNVIKGFDFFHCMSTADLKSLTVTFLPESYFSAKKKKLLYSGAGNPLSGLYRFAKLTTKRGYYCAPEELQKIINRIHELNLGNPKELLAGFVDYYGVSLSDRIDFDIITNKSTSLTHIDNGPYAFPTVF